MVDIHLHYPSEKQLPENIFVECDRRFVGAESSFDGLLEWLWSRYDELTSVVFTLQMANCVHRTDRKRFCRLRSRAAHTLSMSPAFFLDFDSIFWKPDVAVANCRFGPKNTRYY